LANLIRRASAWADSLCNQKLAATVDTRTGRWHVLNDGTIRVPLQYTPILGITAVTAGWTPSTMSALSTVSLADVWPDSNNVVTIPVTGSGNSLIYPNYYRSLPDDIYATVQYINGWFDAQVTSTIAAGVTSVPVTSMLGLNPGQTVYLYGGTDGETVTVDPTFVPTAVPGPGTVPITAATVNAYQLGDTLTAMPQQIKQAVISLTCVLVKTRGAESIQMPSMRGQAAETDKMESGASDDWEAAVDLLQEFKRVT
jgi:hypothetical protein